MLNSDFEFCLFPLFLFYSVLLTSYAVRVKCIIFLSSLLFISRCLPVHEILPIWACTRELPTPTNAGKSPYVIICQCSFKPQHQTKAFLQDILNPENVVCKVSEELTNLAYLRVSEQRIHVVTFSLPPPSWVLASKSV